MDVIEETRIIESCGCVFCDLAREPDAIENGHPAHKHRHGFSICTNADALAARDALAEFERDGGTTLDDLAEELKL